MTAIFITILNMSITASIVALAVMLVRIPLKKAPKIFSYALWGVVLFRLVFPFSIESAFSLMPTSTNITNIIPQDIISAQNSGIQLAGTPINMTIYNPMPIAGQGNETNLVISAIEIASYVWLVGFIVLLVYAVMGYVSLKRRVRFATLVRDNIFESDRVKTPFVFGFIRPKIYFPTMIDPTRHDYILKHEQVHIKRCDYLIKPFAYVVFALHWFNPLMWAAYFLMSRDMEMSCDEAVLKKTDRDIRRNYSTSLLSLSTKRASLVNPIAFSIGEGNVKGRIVNVLKFKKSASWVTALSVIVVGIFLVGFSSDRILAIDVPANSISADAVIFDISSWHTDEQGARVADSEKAEEIGLYILNRYFSTFRNNWESWDDNSFSLIAHPSFVDEFGNTHAQPWTGGVFASELTVIEDAVWGDMSFFAPLFLFHIDAETGRLTSAMYAMFTTDIVTNLAPFAFSFEEGFEIYGNEWRELSSAIHNEYVDMLIRYSLAFLDELELSSGEIVSAELVNVLGDFFDSNISVAINVSFADGKNAGIIIQVHETHFTFEGLTLNF